MKALILRLDPLTRDELYSDISDMFMDFVMVEAIFNVLNDFITRPGSFLDAISDAEYYKNDPECCLAASTELLMDVLKEMDKQDGVDITSPEYDLETFSGWVTDKLCLAISSITTANKPMEFMSMHQLLEDPALSQRMKVTGRHLGNTVVLMIEGGFVNEFL